VGSLVLVVEKYGSSMALKT
jgi:hypothetical protein